MIDFVEFVASESARFLEVVRTISARAEQSTDRSPLVSVDVPACPEWNVADLVWHLGEVQYFWASIVEGNLANPGAVEPLTRPDDAELEQLMVDQSTRLVARLSERGPGEPCWSWHPDGGRVSWVRRRQAHEALIHRIDAEQALATLDAGDGSTGSAPIDEDLAADGVDEFLTVMFDEATAPPSDGFEPDGTSVRIEVPGRAWSVVLGRSPAATGPDVDAESVASLRVLNIDDGPEPSATVAGPASEIDRWVWRRGGLQAATIDGDRSVVDRFLAMAELE